jgi:single-strand DNA-binding protein
MNGLNRVILAGNVTREPEIKYTPQGSAIASFGLAINRKWKDQNSGELKEDVTFVDLTAFGKQAETIGQYVKKGQPILIEGRLKLDQWEDKQTGQKRSKLGVVVESFTFLGTSGNAQEGRPQQPAPERKPMPSKPKTGELIPEEDGVPF